MSVFFLFSSRLVFFLVLLSSFACDYRCGIKRWRGSVGRVLAKRPDLVASPPLPLVDAKSVFEPIEGDVVEFFTRMPD